MTKDITKLIRGKLLAKAIALTLTFGAGFFASATAQTTDTNVPTAKTTAGIMVRGIVKDSIGSPLPGAGIKVKGSATTASADVNGAFSITVPDANSILIITYIGYDTQEIVVGAQKALEISMKETKGTNLKEIAIVGFGTQKKESLVGAQSSVSADELKQPVSSFEPIACRPYTGRNKCV